MFGGLEVGTGSKGVLTTERGIMDHFRTWKRCQVMASTAEMEDVTSERRNISSEVLVKEEKESGLGTKLS